jgi:hypothetical protein
MKVQAYTAAVTTVCAERVGLTVKTLVSEQYDEKSYAEAWILRMTEAAERATPDFVKVVSKVSMSIIDTDDFEEYEAEYLITIERNTCLSQVIQMRGKNSQEAENKVQANVDNNRYEWDEDTDFESGGDEIVHTEENL